MGGLGEGRGGCIYIEQNGFSRSFNGSYTLHSHILTYMQPRFSLFFLCHSFFFSLSLLLLSLLACYYYTHTYPRIHSKHHLVTNYS
ncbi:hypothetical protein M441DRAFT_282176 [Trichoderma asperellum CBS 433.97]|uniref:Uncharacterized protein n=1 Tax=Trichoderma asperellum (strain ATCC 204424 / CBS 433.97 / NBRC 101777) TaxID=1042311 RepID=A0A2T3YVP8_TRIA4|nr:hypothetical protein M441DRAFT_282176 [Trichoderma asperellum CBS 433.97]PTB36606.1 hypothetical protein M441DRAFT_282176 [Trichoderma asperellum CBS 433.97]